MSPFNINNHWQLLIKKKKNGQSSNRMRKEFVLWKMRNYGG